MFKKSTIKKPFIVIFGAMLMCLVLVFAACNGAKAFKPVELPPKATVDANDNGTVAVKYGDYIYYVNGYKSSYTSDNAYTDEIRTGSIVRIKAADLDEIVKMNDLDLSSSDKTKQIHKAVAEKAQTVIPNFYYSGNTTSTDLNGIYIFNDRIYITTPNNELDANGNYLSSQLVLASYNMGGGDMKRHYVFATNAPELKLSQIRDDVYATFVLDNKLNSLKVGDKEATVIKEEISGAKFSGDFVYFIDKDGAICQYKTGDAEAKVLVQNEDKDTITYTIQSANGEYVYYTVADGSQTAGMKLFYATSTKTGVALDTVPTGNYYGWKEKVIYTSSVPEEVVTIYGIWVASGDGQDKTVILDPAQNAQAITFNKLVGDVLYFTANSISYTLDLNDAVANPEGDNAKPYAYALSSTATGWALPHVMGEYTFTLTDSTVTVVKYNAATKNNNLPSSTNSSSSDITLTVIEESDK